MIQNGKCHLSCLHVQWVDTAYSDGSGKKYVICDRDEEKHCVGSKCPYNIETSVPYIVFQNGESNLEKLCVERRVDIYTYGTMKHHDKIVQSVKEGA